MCYKLTINSIEDIRDTFAEMYEEEEFVTDKTGVKMLEILSSQFFADEDSIFGKPKEDYLQRELQWYLSMSQNIKDFPPPVPKLWESTAGKNGETNSNYGWVVYSPENHWQMKNVCNELSKFSDSRRAIIIYTRPTMHTDYYTFGKSDFMCTNSVQYFIRGEYLHAHVSMRSNDAVFGYKADYFWQKYVLEDLCKRLQETYDWLKTGRIIWNVGSLHIYERHFNLVEKYLMTGEWK